MDEYDLGIFFFSKILKHGEALPHIYGSPIKLALFNMRKF